MHDKIKRQKVLHYWRNIFKMNIFFGSIAKSHIQSPIKSLWWSLFAKIVNNFQLLTFSVKKPHHKCQIVLSVKKKERNYPTLFYIILHDFKNYPAFVDITLCIINQQEYINIIREMFFFFLHCSLCFFAFLCWIKFCSGCFRQDFFHLQVKKSGC